jgi:hypothetical protein
MNKVQCHDKSAKPSCGAMRTGAYWLGSAHAGPKPTYHFPPTSTHGSSLYEEVPMEFRLTACVHSAAKVFPAEKMAAGLVFVIHSGVAPGQQILPVKPTSARVPLIAT